MKFTNYFELFLNKLFMKVIILFIILFCINSELVYLLNDEIIFDFVLISLLLFINNIFSNKNFVSNYTTQQELINLYIFIYFYLKNWNYFLLRKKKLEKIILILFLTKIQHNLSNLLNIFVNSINQYMINEVITITYKKYIFLTLYKKLNLNQAILNSFKTKLFYI